MFTYHDEPLHWEPLILLDVFVFFYRGRPATAEHTKFGEITKRRGATLALLDGERHTSLHAWQRNAWQSLDRAIGVVPLRKLSATIALGSPI